jgi:SAM-dependent methyltransferase
VVGGIRHRASLYSDGMPYVILLAPSSNRVYAGEAARLMAAELRVLLGRGRGTDEHPAIAPTMIAGIGYLGLALDDLDDHARAAIGGLSGFLAAFRRDGDHLLPVEAPRPDHFDDDLVTIPKYPGKTNEQFTRMLINVTLASMVGRARDPASILDPLCGRGTTLSSGLTLGHDVAGVEGDLKAIEAYAAFLRSYLRRKRLKHTVEMSPVRRDGKSLGRRLDATITPPDGGRPLSLAVFSGDTRQSAALFGKRRFDAVVADAPYGVVHGSHSDVRGTSGKRDRSAAGLITEALPIWAGQLKPGGALGLSWNTHGLSRVRLVELAAAAGLRPLDAGPYCEFGHRVDSSIHRDILVAVAETPALSGSGPTGTDS